MPVAYTNKKIVMYCTGLIIFSSFGQLYSGSIPFVTIPVIIQDTYIYGVASTCRMAGV